MRMLRGVSMAVVIGFCAPLTWAAQSDEAGMMLERAIQAELVDGDLDRSIALYEEIVDRYPDDRDVAAQALLNMARSYEKLGAPEARNTYERVINEYGDRSREVAEAREGLAGLVDVSSGTTVSDTVVNQAWTRPASTIPVRSPDNQRLLIFSDLTVQDRNTGETRRLSSDVQSAAYPLLSPDGRQVAYVSWREAAELPWNPRREAASAATINVPLSAELRLVSLDGSGDRVLLSREGVQWLRPFEWSPDGSRILVVLERGDSTNEIALVSAQDGSTRILKSLEWRYPESLGFSSDGRYVAYMLPNRGGGTQQDVFMLEVFGPEGPTPENRYSLAVPGQQTPLSSEDRELVHILNRLGFGPRLGDIERVRAMGIESYIERQLNPESIPDPAVERLLAGFQTLDMTSEELAQLMETSMPVPQLAARTRVFEQRRIMERSVADGMVPRPMSMEEFRRAADAGDPGLEIRLARVIRAVYSERQLQELMVDFWMNHFNINFNGDLNDVAAVTQSADFEENVIRPHTLGRFEDLLMAVAKHPAMLTYLDNRVSSAPAEVIEARIEELEPTLDLSEALSLRERRPFLEEARGLNENYARELLELHTVGIDGGYTQDDIVEIAKVLTGWTTTAWQRGDGVTDIGREGGRFVFDGLLHVEGDKVVMGETIPSGGIEEGEQLIRMLARHPSTARFIATKLARRFVADDPPRAVVDAAAETFLRSGGDIREVLRTIFTSPGFRAPAVHGAKIKKPFELIVSSLRAVDAEIVGPLPGTINAFPSWIRLIVSTGGNNGRAAVTERMGERLYNYEAPDGNPDVGAAWINSNALLARLEFANELATNRVPGVRADLQDAEALLSQIGLPRPTDAQIAETREMIQNALIAEASGQESMAGGGMMAGGNAATADSAISVTDQAVIVASMLGSPQFQTR